MSTIVWYCSCEGFQWLRGLYYQVHNKISLIHLIFKIYSKVFYILFQESKNCFKKLISHYLKVFFLYSNVFLIFTCHLPILASRALSHVVSTEIQIALLKRKKKVKNINPKTNKSISQNKQTNENKIKQNKTTNHHQQKAIKKNIWLKSF